MIKLGTTRGKGCLTGRPPLVTRGYTSAANRTRAIAQLRKQKWTDGRSWNYFITYRDTRAEFALQYSIADWVKPGQVHID